MDDNSGKVGITSGVEREWRTDKGATIVIWEWSRGDNDGGGYINEDFKDTAKKCVDRPR